MSIKERLHELEIIIQDKVAFSDFSGGISQKNLLEVESKLGILFPLNYCWFLLSYGTGYLGDTEIFGIIQNENGDIENCNSIPDVRWTTCYLRENYQLPDNYFVVTGDGFGNYICVKADKEKRNIDGEIMIMSFNDEGMIDGKYCYVSTLQQLFEECIEVGKVDN